MKKLCNPKSAGFTLVEFIVIMSIFAIMVGVAVFNFSGFRSNVITENLAHDIAITLRNIQAGGGASQSMDTDPASEQRRGIYFGKEGQGFLKEMILFIDTKNDGGYNDEDERIDTLTIQSSDYIKNISRASLDGDNKIDFENMTPIQTSISVTFGRFSTAPYFSPSSESDDHLVITVGNDNGIRDRSIIISPLGQISVY